MRQEFLILLYYPGPAFSSSLAYTQAAEHGGHSHPETTCEVCVAPPATDPCPQDAPELTPNLFWFIQDAKDRGSPQSTDGW